MLRRQMMRFGLAVLALMSCCGLAAAQAPAVPSGIEGQWQGTLQLSGGRQLRILLKVSKATDGSLTALNYSIDQSPQPMRTADVSLQGNVFHYAVPSLGNSFVSLVKDTSLAATIQVPELFRQGQLITARTFEVFTIYTSVAMVYWGLSSLLDFAQARGERRANRHVMAR